jgi:hypothetical protein
VIGIILALLTLDPIPAAHVAAWYHGVPVADLVRVCRRESRCQRIGVHPTDEHLDGYGGQIRLGHLDPSCQAHGGRPYRWTTRGPWGLSAASHWHRLPRCYQPEWLDLPIVSAMVAAGKYRDRCMTRRTHPWCPGRQRR